MVASGNGERILISGAGRTTCTMTLVVAVRPSTSVTVALTQYGRS